MEGFREFDVSKEVARGESVKQIPSHWDRILPVLQGSQTTLRGHSQILQSCIGNAVRLD